MLSPVWSDALEISELMKPLEKNEAEPSVDQKRKFQEPGRPLKFTEPVDAMRIVFGLLSDDPELVNRNVEHSPLSSSRSSHRIAKEVVRIADKYDIPEVHK